MKIIGLNPKYLNNILIDALMFCSKQITQRLILPTVITYQL